MAGVAAPLATMLTGRMPRRAVLLMIAVTMAAGNVISALAPGYALFLVSRLISGLFHGLMWSIVACVAIRLVAEKDGARAAAAVFSGISLALVLGVPLTSFIGTHWGWRPSFVTLAGVCAVSGILIRGALPALPSHGVFAAADLRSLTRSRRLRTILLFTGAVVIGNYAAYTYIAAYLEERGIAANSIGGYLVGYGIAGVLGNIAAGTLLSRLPSIRVLLVGLTTAMTAALIFVGISRSVPALWVFLVIWGITYSAVPVVAQTMVLRAHEPHQGEAATSLYVLVFNCSIAAGALVGAFGVDAGGPAMGSASAPRSQASGR
ncbi:MAG: MFS transporter [Gordonia sp. (in: high G+C Gram-positive bacteria)]